ncbi:MAG: N-acetylneuraminate synthase family protein [Anaerolineales bacterium]
MTHTEIAIGKRKVGPGHPALIIGEVAQAHDGSLGTAHAFIDAIAAAGADAVKFQTHIAEAESTPQEKFRVAFSKQDVTRFDYWKRMEFSEEQWRGLAQHARESKLLFLSSPFSVEAAELLEGVGVPAWKVASGEVSNTPMLEKIVATRKPVLLSAGMSPWEELDRVVALIKGKSPLAIFQCTTAYPCPPGEIGLNVMEEMRARYAVPVGLSDHSGKIYAGLAAASLGANLIEVHVTLSREMFGPDVPASLMPTELGQLVEGVRFIEAALAAPVNKDKAAGRSAESRRLFFHSIVAKQDLPAGTVLAREHLTTKKPGTGMAPERMAELVGRTLARDVKRDQLLAEKDLAR